MEEASEKFLEESSLEFVNQSSAKFVEKSSEIFLKGSLKEIPDVILSYCSNFPDKFKQCLEKNMEKYPGFLEKSPVEFLEKLPEQSLKKSWKIYRRISTELS